MGDYRISINLRCLFCENNLDGPENAEFQSGDLIKCATCGELNDYDSVLEVAKEDSIAITEDILYGAIRGILKKK